MNRDRLCKLRTFDHGIVRSFMLDVFENAVEVGLFLPV